MSPRGRIQRHAHHRFKAVIVAVPMRTVALAENLLVALSAQRIHMKPVRRGEFEVLADGDSIEVRCRHGDAIVRAQTPAKFRNGSVQSTLQRRQDRRQHFSGFQGRIHAASVQNLRNGDLAHRLVDAGDVQQVAGGGVWIAAAGDLQFIKRPQALHGRPAGEGVMPRGGGVLPIAGVAGRVHAESDCAGEVEHSTSYPPAGTEPLDTVSRGRTSTYSRICDSSKFFAWPLAVWFWQRYI